MITLISVLSGVAAGLFVTILGTVFHADDEDPFYPSVREQIQTGVFGTLTGSLILYLILVSV